MDVDMKEAFTRIKPVCDAVMIRPSVERIAAFTARIPELKKEAIQGLQQYLLFPFITHLKSSEIENKYDLQAKLVDGMRIVLDKVIVDSYEMCMKIETGLLSLIFDNAQPGMVANVPEELKLSVMKCLTVLMLNLDNTFRVKLLKTQVPLLAQAVFVAVHIAKLEKMRTLRLAAIGCVTAHTVTHPQLTNEKFHIEDQNLEALIADVLSSILPGVLAALQDVATCPENPGHAVVVASINAIHRILCLTMHDKFYTKRVDVSAEDFAKMLKEKSGQDKKEKSPPELVKRSAAWYAMAGDKLLVVARSLAALAPHEHARVRRELALFCARLLAECTLTMQPSIPTALDVLISLSKDEYPQVATFCKKTLKDYFATTSTDSANKSMDALGQNFIAILNSFPRILNNIDSAKKMSALHLVHGYVEILCEPSRPHAMSSLLAAPHNLRLLTHALTEAAALTHPASLLATHTDTGSWSAGAVSPWLQLRHWQSPAPLQALCGALAGAAPAPLLLDELTRTAEPHALCLANWLATAPSAATSLSRRLMELHTEEAAWRPPLQPRPARALDPDGQPRDWTRDHVPGLYEGAIEVRYTDISYSTPRVPVEPALTLGEAQRNMLLACLRTEGVGMIATRLGEEFQPYLLKILCMLLERIGSKYEMLHFAGVQAATAVAAACGHHTVADLIRCNADYVTNQVTSRLKKSWQVQSGLEILSVVMKHCDANSIDYLYGIVEDVLVQSCDMYYVRDLYAYLQVFLTFIECISKWFVKAPEGPEGATGSAEGATSSESKPNILQYVIEYNESETQCEKLLSDKEFENETGKSAEEMYREDLANKEGDELDYDDIQEKVQAPRLRHLVVTVSILRRCVNFISCRRKEDAILALLILEKGLPILAPLEDELLPIVHQVWSPLSVRLGERDPIIMRRAIDLLATLAELSKDFIRDRAIKSALPSLCSSLCGLAQSSRLQDAGAAYRCGAAYRLQLCALARAARLPAALRLPPAPARALARAACPYLSNRQPRPLQELAVTFFKELLDYNRGLTWLILQELANNEEILQPPKTPHLKLVTITGTPYETTDKEYANNLQLIFNS